MTEGKMLSQIVREGMNVGYEPLRAVEIYTIEQSKQYNRSSERNELTQMKKDELDIVAKDITSRFFKIYKPHDLILKHYGSSCKASEKKYNV